MAGDTGYVARYLEPRLIETVGDTPACVILGARQSGKSTFVEHFARTRAYEYVTFDDPAAVGAMDADPVGYLESLGPRVVLDEVQRIARHFTSIKLLIDRDRQPGRFVMTGSANILAVPQLGDSLAGRMALLRMHPLSQVEMRSAEARFLDALFASEWRPVHGERLGSALAELVVRGGFPAAQELPQTRAAAYLSNHAETQIQRDVKTLADIRSLETSPDLLRQVSAYTAQLSNVSKMSRDLEIARDTVKEHLVLLRHIYVIERVRAWGKTERARAVKAPKLHVADTGLACALLGYTAASLNRDRVALGHMVETFVLNEMLAQAAWSERPTRFYHYRDTHQSEVDIVLERSPMEVAGVEVKSSSIVRTQDFTGLRKLRDSLGESFVGGVVLYDGPVGYRVDDRLWAMPISTLWKAGE